MSNKQLVVDSFGDLFTREDFIESIEAGALIDYDGWGYYSDGTYEFKDLNHIVHPSEVLEDGFNDCFSHVVWYNK